MALSAWTDISHDENAEKQEEAGVRGNGGSSCRVLRAVRMCAEIAKAKRHGKKIRYFDSSCSETNRALEIGPERLQEER